MKYIQYSLVAIILYFLMVTLATHAEVYKCKLASGKITYQSTPCPVSENQKVIEIKKQSPEEILEAQKRLKAWQTQQEAEEAAKIKAAKELHEEKVRQENIDALERNTIAQQQQAIAAQRQAEALERQQRSQYPSIFARPPDH